MPPTANSAAKIFIRAPISSSLSKFEEEEKKLLPTMPSTNTTPVRSTKWADGLRGISAMFVLSSHLVLSFDRSLVLPSTSENGPTKLFQRPIFRLIAQGPAWVAIFFILLGYVNSLKVIKLSRQGKIDEALNALTVASFRRTFRLVFPAAAVTVISWFATQLGVYELARRTDAYWLQVYSPPPSPTWSAAFHDLFHELVGTWIWAENKYDQPQWALFYLLKASMYVFMFLLATARVTPRARLLCAVGLWFWSWSIGDVLIGPNVFAGVMLAELTYLPTPRLLSSLSPLKKGVLNLIPYLLTPVALTLMSFPSSYTHLTHWSNYLQQLGTSYFPATAWDENGQPYLVPSVDLGRAWPGFGAQLLCLCILLSPGLRRVFESGTWMSWLGSVSMGIYLLHGSMMRSVLTYLVFGPKLVFDWRERRTLAAAKAQEQAAITAASSSPASPPPAAADGQSPPSSESASDGPIDASSNSNEVSPETQTQPDQQQPDSSSEEPPPVLTVPQSTLLILLAIAVFVVILLTVVQYWNKRIEPVFARATAWTEKICLPRATTEKARKIDERDEREQERAKRRQSEDSAGGSGCEGSGGGSSGDEGRRRGMQLAAGATGDGGGGGGLLPLPAISKS